MANETIITAVGNLTGDPELRFTPSGTAVANFVIANTPRFFDRQANEYKDGETLFVRCTIWKEAAENAAESLTKGTRVIAQGRMKAQSWQDKTTGEKRTGWELEADEVGPSLRFATAQVQRSQPKQGGQQGGGFGGGQPQSGGWGQQPAAQSGWGGGQPADGGWETPQSSEAPF